jgi:hypothetical protein
VVRRKIARAVTDADALVRHDPERKPGVSNLLEILSACTGPSPHALAGQFTSHRQLKDAVADAVVELLTPLQHRYAEIAADPGYLARLLHPVPPPASSRRPIALEAPTAASSKPGRGTTDGPPQRRLLPICCLGRAIRGRSKPNRAADLGWS